MDERGYYKKYRIERVDGKPVDPWTFVLEAHDPHAIPALSAYAASVRAAGNADLADDLEAKCAELRA